MGAPRIHGELLKLGIDVGETSVGKYMVRHLTPPSQTWRTCLDNHVKTMVSVDFFTVPDNPFPDPVRIPGAGSRASPDTPVQTSPPIPRPSGPPQQLREAFPFDQIPRYLLRDRDGIFGSEFRTDVKAMGFGSALGASVAMATGLCGTRDRHNSPRVPGPRDRLL